MNNSAPKSSVDQHAVPNEAPSLPLGYHVVTAPWWRRRPVIWAGGLVAAILIAQLALRSTARRWLPSRPAHTPSRLVEKFDVLGPPLMIEGRSPAELDYQSGRYTRQFDYTVSAVHPLALSDVRDLLEGWVSKVVRVRRVIGSPIEDGFQQTIDYETATTSGTMTYTLTQAREGRPLGLRGEIRERDK